MTVYGLIFAVTFNIICVENREIPHDVYARQDRNDPVEDPVTQNYPEEPARAVIGLKVEMDNEEDSSGYIEFTKPKPEDATDKPCSVVVLSHVQYPNMQSLIRKYRYDERGMLIPGSVKYYIKFPQPSGSQPVLVPLNDKAFSPLGGFVRYYKEVPPIPQSW